MRVNGKKEWGSSNSIMYSHGSKNARGVAVLIGTGLVIVIQHEYSDSKGRLIMLNAKIKDKNYFPINLYGPNKDVEAVRFYQDLSITLRGFDLDSDSNVILGGDFNCPIDRTSDKNGGILIPRQHVINSITNIGNEFSIQDIWCIVIKHEHSDPKAR